MQVLEKTVTEIVTEYPKMADIFREKDIDFCHIGRSSLIQAAKESGHDENEIMSLLKEVIQNETKPRGFQIDAGYLSVAGLVEYIQNRYHKPLRSELMALKPYINEISSVHNGQDAHATEIYNLYKKLKVHLFEHTEQENRRVFPELVQFADDPSSVPEDNLEEMIRDLSSFHNGTEDLLKRMRTLTDDFTPPENTGVTYHLLYVRLEKLERDTFQHMYIEQQALFSKMETLIRN